MKRLYLANDTHTDLMWNGTEEQWTKWTYEMADFYLAFGERTASREYAYRSKWNYDAAWNLYTLEKNYDSVFFKRLMDQYKAGQASVPYNFTLATYGGFTPEWILRSFYYAGYLERTYGIDIELGTAIESSTIPLGLASLWAGTGAKYSWKGVCNCATKINVKGDRDYEIYWYTGLDGSRILMKWYSMYGPNAELGGYSEMLEPSVAIRQMDELCGSDRYPYRIAGAFSKGWDNGRNFSIDVHALVKHRTLPGTQVILSNEMDFFHDFESTYGDILPSETLSYGNEWDLYPATMPGVSSKLRRSLEKLRNAEAMAALTCRSFPERYHDLDPLKEDFYYGLSVYGLHGWTADGPWVSRDDFADWARRQQEKVTRYVDSLYTRSAADLGMMIPVKKKKTRFYVFNALNFSRSGIVLLEGLPEAKGMMRNLDTDVIHQVYRYGEGEAAKAYILADEIPEVGYEVFEWEDDDPVLVSASAFHVSEGMVETPFYKILFEPDGAITSLIEKKTGREWSGEVLNRISPGTLEHSETLPYQMPASPDGKMTVEQQNSKLLQLRFESSDPVKHMTLVSLYADDPRIEIDHTVKENFHDPLYVTFDFNMDLPSVWHEEVGAVIQAKLHSNGGHYAEAKARYDHLSFNHFLWIGDDVGGMVLSNADCSFFKLGESKPTFLDESSSTIHAFIGGMVDDKRGIYNVGGDSVFTVRFSLLPRNGSFDQTESMQFALDHQNPLVAGLVTGDRDAEMPETKYSLFSSTDSDVLLWSLKPGEEGGTILRFWNMKDLADPLFTFDSSPVLAQSATHVETIIKPLKLNGNRFRTNFRQQQMCTFRFDW